MREKILRRVRRCLAGEDVSRCHRVSPTVVDYRMPGKLNYSGTIIRVIKIPFGWIFKCGDMIERIQNA